MADPNALVNALALSGSADPADLIRQQLQAQQQQALASALMQQGVAPMSGTESIGGVAIRRSPMEGVAKLAALLSGQSIQGQANDKSVGASLAQAQALRSAFGMGDPAQQPSAASAALGAGAQQGSVGPTNANAQLMTSMAPAQAQGGGLSMPGAPPMTNMMSYMADPAAHMKALMDQYAMTPEMKQAAAAFGVGTPGYFDALRKVVAKAGNIPPVRMQPGGGVIGPDGKITTMPGAPPAGYQNVQRPDGSWSVAPVGGGLGAVQSSNQAAGLGKAGAVPSVAYGPDGTPIFSTQLQDIARANGWAPPTGGLGAAQAASTETPDRLRSALQILQQERAQAKAADVPALDRQIAALTAKLQAPQGQQSPQPPVTPTQRPGVVTSANTAAEKAQSDLDARFGALRTSAAGAQTTNSYLDEIERLAPIAATGRFSDKLDLVNSLLAPFSQKATDAASANDLLDKYSNQIVARLGAGDGKGGGLGTDAARAILQSAYPNATMQVPAVKEAASSIRGLNAMTQAKLQYLSPQGNARDPVSYQQREQQFDLAADPRVFQLANMSGDQAKAFLAKQPPAVQADLRKRAAALKQMGVF